MEVTDADNDDRRRVASRRAATTLGRVERNDPTLRGLKVSGRFDVLGAGVEGDEGAFFWPGGGADLARFGAAIGANTSVGQLLVYDHGTLEAAADDNGAFFEGLGRNSSIRVLAMMGFDFSGGLGRGLFDNFVASNGVLEMLAVTDCGLGNGGLEVFFSAVSSCPNLKIGSLVRCDIDDDLLEEFVSGVRRWKVLSVLHLSGNNFGGVGCDKLSMLLQDQDCNLGALGLSSNDRIDDACANKLANSLKGNCKLLKLDLSDTAITEDGWKAFSNLLCNRASVNDTYCSNHDLGSLGEEDGLVLPIYLSSLLRLNRLEDKKRVATLKILLHHTDLEMKPFFEWKLKMLPTVASWLDSARDCDPYDSFDLGARKLSAIYKFARAFPDEIEASRNGGAKRKISEMN